MYSFSFFKKLRIPNTKIGRKRATETNTDKVELTLTVNGTKGYYINGSARALIATTDSLYIWHTKSGTSVSLASPASDYGGSWMSVTYGGYVSTQDYTTFGCGVRPVVCLNSNIPAQIGTTTDFAI